MLLKNQIQSNKTNQEIKKTKYQAENQLLLKVILQNQLNSFPNRTQVDLVI